MTSIPVVLFPTLASLWQASNSTNLILLWLLSTFLAQHSIWMHLFYLTLLLPSTSSLSFNICSVLSKHQIACGIWTALLCEQLLPSFWYLPLALLLMTSFSLRFLPTNVFCAGDTSKSSQTIPQNNPSYSSSYRTTAVPWCDWTAEQVQEWVQSHISADPDTVRIFRQHQILGMDLAQLSVQEYHSIGLRLGVACQLQRAVENLQRNDTRPNVTSSVGWLKQLDQQQQQYDVTNSTRQLSYEEYSLPADEPISTEAVNAIFHERFGSSLELPELSSHRDFAISASGLAQRRKVLATVKEDGSLSSIHSKNNGVRADIPLVQNGLPCASATDETVLSFLPPHIKSIYQHKPHLVEQMILARRQRSEEQTALLSQDEQNNLENEGAYHSIS